MINPGEIGVLSTKLGELPRKSWGQEIFDEKNPSSL